MLFNKNNKQLSTSRKTDLLGFADPANQCDQFVYKYEADIHDRRVTRFFSYENVQILKQLVKSNNFRDFIVTRTS